MATVAKEITVNAMVEGMQQFVKRVPVSVEASIGDTWSKS